jgi:hypothetical protein
MTDALIGYRNERKKKRDQNAHHLKAILVESFGKFVQCLGSGAEKSQRVGFIVVRSDECGSPGAEGAISEEFDAADSKPFVKTIINQARYLGAPIIIGGDVAH